MCRLLAWATDIEAQLGLQRQELRRSRVELASAQEVCIHTYHNACIICVHQKNRGAPFCMALLSQNTMILDMVICSHGIYWGTRI